MTQKITAIFGIAVLAAVLLGGLTFSQSVFAGGPGGGGQEKVTLCHVDQVTGEEKTITIGAPAVSHHLQNHIGDHVGECDPPEPELHEGFCECASPPIAFAVCGEVDCEVLFAECETSCDTIEGFACDPVESCDID